MSHHRVKLFSLTGSTQTKNVPSATPQPVFYFGGIVEGAAGSIIITDASGAIVDQIAAGTGTPLAVGSRWFGPNGIECNGPLTVTVTGTVAGSLYLG